MIRRREANQAKPSVPNKAAHIHRESGDAVEAASVIMGGMTGVVVVDRCHKDAHIVMPFSGGKTIELLIFERFGYIYIYTWRKALRLLMEVNRTLYVERIKTQKDRRCHTYRA
jgi:hypothetical protein